MSNSEFNDEENKEDKKGEGRSRRSFLKKAAVVSVTIAGADLITLASESPCQPIRTRRRDPMVPACNTLGTDQHNRKGSCPL